jgi:hypothetical protein
MPASESCLAYARCAQKTDESGKDKGVVLQKAIVEGVGHSGAGIVQILRYRQFDTVRPLMGGGQCRAQEQKQKECFPSHFLIQIIYYEENYFTTNLRPLRM